MSAELKFRRLNLQDLPKLMEIERLAYEFPWSASMVRDAISAAHCQAWGLISEDNQILIGYFILSIVMDEAEVLSMAVNPEYTRKGYGGALLTFVITRAKKAKVDKILLEVRETNVPAINLYRKQGFVEYGVRPGYYPVSSRHERENATLMVLKLNQEDNAKCNLTNN